MSETPETPDYKEQSSIDATPKIVQVSAMTGFKWLGQSFNLFSKNPSIWVVMLIIYLAISLILTRVPLLALLPALLAPLFNAGFVKGAQSVDNGMSLEIDHLFSGFKLQFKGLFRLGMIYFLFNMLIIIIASVALESFADETVLMAMNQATTTIELEQILLQHPQLLVALFKALMIGMILSIPLIMASWFAPILVMFHQMTPVKAMLLSIKACNRNMLPFLFFGLLTLPLMLLALVPFGLGLLIMVPVIFISQYSSYKSVFSQQQSDTAVFLV